MWILLTRESYNIASNCTFNLYIERSATSPGELPAAVAYRTAVFTTQHFPVFHVAAFVRSRFKYDDVRRGGLIKYDINQRNLKH